MSNIQRTEEEILTDAFYGVDNSQSSGTNEEELDDEAPETEEVEEITEEESEVNEETGEDSEPEPVKVSKETKKPQSNVAKLLAERNALRKQLQEKMASQYDWESLQDIESLIEERATRKIEETLFFRDNPTAKEIADDIRAVAREHNMDIEHAYKFHLAMTNPAALVDQQTLAKSEAKKQSVSGVWRRPTPKTSDPYSPEKMAEMNKKWKEQYLR